MHALRDREVDVRRDVRRQLALESGVEAVDARVLVIAVEHPDAGEQRKRARRHGAWRQQVRPHRHVGEPGKGRVAIVALLLDAVGRDRSDLAQHVLPGVEDAGAGADDRLAVLVHVPGHADSRLKLLQLIRNRAVGRKTRIVQEKRVRRRLRDRRSRA